MRDIVAYRIHTDMPVGRGGCWPIPRPAPPRRTSSASPTARAEYLRFLGELAGLGPTALERLAAGVRPRVRPPRGDVPLGAARGRSMRWAASCAHCSPLAQRLGEAEGAAPLLELRDRALPLNDRSYLARVHPLELWLEAHLQANPRGDPRDDAGGERGGPAGELRLAVQDPAQVRAGQAHPHPPGGAGVRAHPCRLAAPRLPVRPPGAVLRQRDRQLGRSAGGARRTDRHRPEPGHPAADGRIERLHFAAATPYETVLELQPAAAQDVLAPQIAEVVPGRCSTWWRGRARPVGSRAPSRPARGRRSWSAPRPAPATTGASRSPAAAALIDSQGGEPHGDGRVLHRRSVLRQPRRCSRPDRSPPTSLHELALGAAAQGAGPTLQPPRLDGTRSAEAAPVGGA